MENLRIRKVNKEDNPYLADIIRVAFDEHNAPKQGTVYSDPTTDHLFQLFQHPGSVLWVARAGRKILGCCGIYPTPGLDPDCAELAKFYILQEARGKGVGRGLMLQCIKSAKELGYKRLYLESLPHFNKAISMYESSGFKSLTGPLGESGHTSCNIWMIKDLWA